MESTWVVMAVTAVVILAVAVALWLPAFLYVRRHDPPPDVPTFRRWPDPK